MRSTGSIPATIGMLGGRIKIGLEPSELEYLADTKSNPSVVKLSRRDIAPAIAQQRDGGTTCSGTLIFAALAGIKVFATGGYVFSPSVFLQEFLKFVKSWRRPSWWRELCV